MISRSVLWSSNRLRSRAIFHLCTTWRSMYGVNGNTNGAQKKLIDLKSDTVTRACPEMRRRMAEAVVGDDVYQEDPTVNSLEERCAQLFDKEAAMFVPSGTMGNLTAIMAHTLGRGEIIVGRTSHIHRWEAGGYARIAHVTACTIGVNDDGTLNMKEMAESIFTGDLHRPQTKLICLENTHNFAGGKALSVEYMKEVRALADQHGIKVHVDGARIFNAAVQQRVTVAELTKDADSVQMCFSKGLGAPIGSILVGSRTFIEQARHDRKVLGGAWRQAGHLAAAAHYALDLALETTKKDHERALRLAKAINAMGSDKLSANENGITNMVLVTVPDPEAASAKLLEAGVLVFPFDNHRMRAVLHRDISDEDVDVAIEAFRLLA